MKEEANKEIKIFFCGDFISSIPGMISLADDLKKIINECDIRCLNFEGAVATGKTEVIKGTAALPQSAESPAWCEENGFNLISLANNHMGDFGQYGLVATLNAFKSACVIGAGNWDEAYKVKKIQIHGLRIGFLSLAQCEFGILNDNWESNTLLGSGWINHHSVNSIIQKEKQSLDYLFVLTHAGLEYTDIPLPEWRDRYKELIEIGADAVIGGHPHVPQGWETHKGKPIFYSLGNFCFEGEDEHKYWHSGLCVIITVDNLKHLSFKIINTLKQHNEIIIDNSDDIQKHNKEICSILEDKSCYIPEINKICLDAWPVFERILLTATNSEKSRFTLKSLGKYFIGLVTGRKEEYKLLLNQIRCESSRFAMIRALKLMTGIRI